MRVILLAATLLVPAVSQATAAGVYKALQTTAIAPADLPKVFSGPTTRTFTPSANSRRHHAVGGVEILLNKGAAAILYVVFPTHADALADWKDAPRLGLKIMKTPAGFPSPALVATGKSSTGSIALASFVSGFVAVEAALQPKGSPGSRDVAAVAALAKGALAHLRTVERKAG